MKELGEIPRIEPPAGVVVAEEQPRPECSTCSSRGMLVSTGKAGLVTAYCPDCSLDEEVARRLTYTNLPSGLAEANLDDLVRPAAFTDGAWEDFQELVDYADAYAHSLDTVAVWLLLAGTKGWGKTTIACAILAHRAKYHPELIPGKFANCPVLLQELRRGYKDDTYEETLDLYLEVPLLMLDDLGVEYHKRQKDGELSWAEEQIYQIINGRYAMRLPTIITTNADAEKIDERLVDRAQDEGSGLVKVWARNWPSFRKEGAA